MSDDAQAKAQTVQRVFETVLSWEESAPREKIRDKFDEGLAEAGVSLPDEQIETLVDHVADRRGPAQVTDLIDLPGS